MIIALCLKYGTGTIKNDARKIIYPKVKKLMELFKEKHGTYICKQLLNNCNLSTEEGRATIKKEDYRNKICKECVITATQLAKGLMA